MSDLENEKQPPRSLLHRAASNPTLSFAILSLVTVSLGICLFFAWLGGYIDAAQRWARSFSFPAIDAQYKPMADQIAAVTHDILIDQSHNIYNTTLMTNDNYTGVVQGEIKWLFATTRPYSAVVDDYKRFFQSQPDWTIKDRTGFTDARNSENTARVIIEPSDAGSPAQRSKFNVFYEITFYYADPILWTGG